MTITLSDLENRFNFHPSDETTGPKHEEVRGHCLNLAVYFNERLPDGREKSLVITKLEEVMFWANAAIARSGK